MQKIKNLLLGKTNMYHNKRVLVTGGTGLVGRELVELLVKSGAKVRSVSLDEDNFDPASLPLSHLFVSYETRSPIDPDELEKNRGVLH